MLSDVLYISHTCIEGVFLYNIFVLHAKCTYAHMHILLLLLPYVTGCNDSKSLK